MTEIDRWQKCHGCGITLMSCKCLTRDRGRGCCDQCDHPPREPREETPDGEGKAA